jgi:uncharacterized protein involved in exopolysaccharide biosynthesis
MGKKQTLQKKYDKLLKEFEDGHRRLKQVKMEMVNLRRQIKEAPNLSEERIDEILLKT